MDRREFIKNSVAFALLPISSIRYDEIEEKAIFAEYVKYFDIEDNKVKLFLSVVTEKRWLNIVMILSEKKVNDALFIFDCVQELSREVTKQTNIILPKIIHEKCYE